MAKDNKNTTTGVGEDIEVAISKTEAFIEKNQKKLMYAIFGIVVIVSGIILFNRYYKVPQEIEAQEQMAKAQNFFAVDSFQVALNGNGIDTKGFLQIIDDYGITKSANLANAYAGISFYKLGEYEKAVDYLKKFKGKDEVNISASVYGLTGDAYVELKQYDLALSYFEKAYSEKNEMLSPLYLKKAALVHEKQGDYDKALEAYSIIKNTYFNSDFASDIDKYIQRAELLNKQ